MTFLLRLLKRLIRAYPVPLRSRLPRTVLVVDLNFLGDMLLSSPVYRALKENLPDVTVDALIYPFARPAVQANPYVDTIYTIKQQGFLRQLPMLLSLRRRHYDMVLQLNTSLRVNAMMWVIGGRLRLGYDYKDRGALNNVRIPIATRTAKAGSRVEECLRLLEQAFGWRVHHRAMLFSVSESDRERVRKLLREQNIGRAAMLIGMHTNSRQGWELRRWDQQKNAELTNRVLQEYPTAIVFFTGVNEDREYVAGILNDVTERSRAIDLAGKISLGEFAALLQELTLFITINTGPMHLAVACKTPTVAIIGGTPAEVVFPMHDPYRRYVMDPALRQWDPTVTQWEYTPAIRQITVEQVMQEVHAVLHLVRGDIAAAQPDQSRRP